MGESKLISQPFIISGREAREVASQMLLLLLLLNLLLNRPASKNAVSVPVVRCSLILGEFLVQGAWQMQVVAVGVVDVSSALSAGRHRHQPWILLGDGWHLDFWFVWFDLSRDCCDSWKV